MRRSSLLLLASLALPLAAHAGCAGDDEAPLSQTSPPPSSVGSAGSAGSTGSAGSAGTQAAGSAGNQAAGQGGGIGIGGAGGQGGDPSKVIACGENAACKPGQTCYTFAGGGDCSNQCTCDKTGHFVCPSHCGAAGPGAYTCDQGAVCMPGSPNFSCTSGNAFCKLTCTCANIDASGKGSLDCKETCDPGATASPGTPCGPGLGCQGGWGCGGLLPDGCQESCTCGPGEKLQCTEACGGP